MNKNIKLWSKSYDPWIQEGMEIPNTTISTLIGQTVQKFPDRPAFRFYDLVWTFAEFSEKADRFACALNEQGIQKGDVLAINLLNSPQYLIAFYGAIKAGVIVSGLSPLLMKNEITFQLSDLKASAVITFDYLLEDRLADVAVGIESLKLIIVTALGDFLDRENPSPKAKDLPGIEVKRLEDILSRSPARAPQVDLVPEDICVIQYTGGTTGVPKGAVLTHHNWMGMQAQFGMWLDTERGKDVLLCPFPMFHVAGTFHAMQGLVFGFTQIIIPDPRDLNHIIEQINRYKPTIMGTAPALVTILLKEADFRKLDFSGLYYCMCGSAPVPVEKAKELEQVIGSNKLAEVYGLSETCSLVSANPRDGVKKVGSIGVPLPATRLSLVDLETGETEVPAGEEGEIIASGPQIMKGYYHNPEETRIALREHDGEVWLHTGDVGRMDEDGYFYIVDRIKDMINVGGYKVFSNEIEQKISKHPAIDQCAIVGVDHPERPGSELVKLVVVKGKLYAEKPDEEARQDLLEYCRNHFAPYKVPKIVEFVEEIPLTRVGKVNKKALRH